MFIAHTSENGEPPQLLLEHLRAVAALAEEFAAAFNAGEWGRLAGLYHDVGKYSKEFQEYIRGAYHGRVDHSTAGAKLMIENQMFLLAFCIAGHHAGLPDYGARGDTPDKPTLCGRGKRVIPDFGAYEEELPKVSAAASPTMKLPVEKNPFSMAFFTRMLFSSLVDADFLDTERYMTGGTVSRGGFEPMPILAERFFKTLETEGFLSPKSTLNEERCRILKRCIAMEKETPGLFSLTVPTGGGKTISSLSFAMAHARAQGKRRIIYAIPYTAIIEQTADIFRGFLGNGNVLEHHANVDYEKAEDGAEQRDQKRLAAENWDAPVIVTTNVQFFESLFANRSSRCRKLHNIADSVLIFDEAQMFPQNFLKPVCMAIEELVRQYGCTVVLCSATQPRLEQFFDIPCREIMSEIPALYRTFRRTHFLCDGGKECEEISAEMKARLQVLCVAATKRTAREIFDGLEADEGNFFLSTDLCPAHRREVIAEIKRRLKEGEPCRVVSTTVISVGVDIDFPTAYLEMSGLDSLIQGAGRANREGKQSWEESAVHIFATERGMASAFMRQERQVTSLVQKKYGDALDSPEAIQMYFDELYAAKGAGLDQKDILGLTKKLAFAQIAENFRLIEEHTKQVLVPFNEEAKELIAKLRLGIRTRELLRKVGTYAVGVRYSGTPKYAGDFEKLYAQGRLELLDENFAVLTDMSVYDEKMGLHVFEENGREIIL